MFDFFFFSPPLLLLKIHAYNLETNTWEEIATKPHKKKDYPAARRCHSCVQIKNDVFVCGGYNGEVILGDIWKLCWEKVLAFFPHLANLSRSQLLHLGLTQGLVERLK
uniref:Kelch domain-containing protein 10 n=1 Tax=Micrurus corallinus TaxID=54390 RepID=A0A2D4GBW1_MICCO